MFLCFFFPFLPLNLFGRLCIDHLIPCTFFPHFYVCFLSFLFLSRGGRGRERGRGGYAGRGGADDSGDYRLVAGGQPININISLGGGAGSSNVQPDSRTGYQETTTTTVGAAPSQSPRRGGAARGRGIFVGNWWQFPPSPTPASSFGVTLALRSQSSVAHSCAQTQVGRYLPRHPLDQLQQLPWTKRRMSISQMRTMTHHPCE